MAQSGVIVRRNPNTFIPNEYLELVIKENPSACGAALADDGLQVNTVDGENTTVEFIQDTMKTFPDKGITFYFCNSEAGINMDDVFPTVVLKDGDTPLIAAFVEGNFPGFAKKESAHPSEFFFTQEYLVPKLADLFEMGETLDKVWQFIQKPNFKKELLGHAVSRGTITLVSETGESLSFTQGDTAAEFPWGWTSNTYGYGAKAEAKKEPEVKKKPSMFPNKSTVREKAAASTSITPPPAPKIEYVVKKDRPPSHLSRSARKDWYKIRIGYLPPLWEKCCEIEFYNTAKGDLVTFAQVKRMGIDAVSLPKLDNPQRGEKDTETENIPHKEEAQPEEKQVTSEILPIMSPKSREYFQRIISSEEVKKIIAEGGDIVATAKQTQAIEAKFADFCTQLGIKSSNITDFMKFPYEWYLKVARENPEGAALMTWTFRNMLASRMSKEALKAEKAEAALVEETAPAAKAKPSMFPKRNVA